MDTDWLVVTYISVTITVFTRIMLMIYRHFHPRQSSSTPAVATQRRRRRSKSLMSMLPLPSVRIPFLTTTRQDFVFDLKADIKAMKRRLRTKQIEFDIERWYREGEALDPNIDIYFQAPMRWWFLKLLGLGSDISWYVLFQDFYFNIGANRIEANQRVLGQEGIQFFDVPITAIANKVPGDPPGRLLERLGVKTVVVTVQFSAPQTIPVLAAGLRWPNDFRDPNGPWVGGEKAVIRILEYIIARVQHGPFTEYITQPATSAQPAVLTGAPAQAPGPAAAPLQPAAASATVADPNPQSPTAAPTATPTSATVDPPVPPRYSMPEQRPPADRRNPYGSE